jgi:hypothetical protein
MMREDPMIDTRTVGHEIQDQVRSAARKGQQRVQSTVRTVTATAAMIRPQLPALPRPKLSSLPKPTLNVPRLPMSAQLRDKAPALTAMLPTPEQLMASAHEFAGQFLAAQRKVFGQVKHVAAPLAQQATAALAQVGIQAPKPAAGPKPVPEHKPEVAEHTEPVADHGAHPKPATARNGARTSKPKAKTTAK